MLYKGKKRLALIWVGKKPVSMMWRGAVKIWEAISSCFGSGVWRSEKPWKGTDKWKLHK